MNSLATKTNRFQRFAHWPWLCGLIMLLLVRPASADLYLYQNLLTVSNNPSFNFGTTNFANGTAADQSATFIFNFGTFGAYGDPELYFTYNTLNHTNYGTMIGNN